jgi:ubiquinone biosynthesis accessory factor UbiJ
MIAAAAASAINRLMRWETWPLERLRPFAGRTALLRVSPFDVALTVLESGEVAAARPDSAPDTTISLTPPLFARLAAGDESAPREVRVDGDAELAAAVFYLSRHLRWDAEEDLSRVFGDVLAHRLAEGGREFLRWQSQAPINVAHMLAEYWTEERPLIARSADVKEFVAEVDRLRDDADRLEKRIERLLDRRDAGNTK